MTREELRARILALPPDLRAMALRDVDRRYATPASTAHRTFRSFVDAVNPRFQWYRWSELLASVLDRVVAGEVKRLLVFCPPRHGKSEAISRLLPAYYLHRYPERWVGLVSYGADLAYKMSRAARAYYRGVRELEGDTAAVREWETGGGGGMFADGIGGSQTGKGFHLGIVDDPLKNDEQASSPTIQEAHRDWWRSTWYTREEPGGSIVVVMTRWNQLDLGGYLLAEEEGGEDAQPEHWHVVCLPAIAEPAEVVRSWFPASCTIEPDWREPGEPLCPERYPLAKLRKIAARIGPYYTSALYRQNPTPPGGTIFQRDRAQLVDAVPAKVNGRTRAWDKAATNDTGDWTVGLRMSDVDGIYYVEDVVRGQWGPDEADRMFVQTAQLDGKAVTIRGPQDPAAAGKRDAASFVRLLSGYPVRVEPVSGPKVLRARPFAAQWAAGNVRLVRGAWNRAFIEELVAFPHGRNDDQVDAAADAFDELTSGYASGSAEHPLHASGRDELESLPPFLRASIYPGL